MEWYKAEKVPKWEKSPGQVNINNDIIHLQEARYYFLPLHSVSHIDAENCICGLSSAE